MKKLLLAIMAVLLAASPLACGVPTPFNNTPTLLFVSGQEFYISCQEGTDPTALYVVAAWASVCYPDRDERQVWFVQQRASMPAGIYTCTIATAPQTGIQSFQVQVGEGVNAYKVDPGSSLKPVDSLYAPYVLNSMLACLP